ncbi:hypothetical protein EDI_097070 [Entamoeba dispar SAW760]|uniref:Uncharacterized protein n=1 Tax=Entamoeba dispar (strain ATCC PRA-260 / SAW760) TaxID=370354 RepID=B0EBD3_ENTDS|nr:uncharacterized protein EDI_097070 [Entamoeba dispar SAW760]EDR28184.1 hypothetical protein EDI_097070 [Entamoeba dispar SAW760]|eukprot:EDR28184.1 hypothetical protein EDI_097070 [Entamoeba dispar SAW760]
MTKVNNTSSKLQSVYRNLSVDRERISNACIIGLLVVLGNSVTVKLPSKKSKNTLAHLSIASTRLNGKEINEIVQEQYNFPNTLDKNKRRDKEVAIFNAVSKSVTGPYFKLAKQTTSVKTLKLRIYKELGPFNKNGVILFGTQVTTNLMNRNPYGRCSQRAFIELKGYDKEIVNIFHSVCNMKENVIENYLVKCPELFQTYLKSEIDFYQKDNEIIRNTPTSEELCFRGVFQFCSEHLYSTETATWFTSE